MKRRTLLKSLVGLLGLPVAAKAVDVPTGNRILDAKHGDVLMFSGGGAVQEFSQDQIVEIIQKLRERANQYHDAYAKELEKRLWGTPSDIGIKN